jgi:hypothetical protein
MSAPTRCLGPLLAISIASCGGETTGPATSADSGLDAFADTTLRVPKIHRPAPVACPTDRPAGSPGGVGGGTCAVDADCTAGKNGRCSGGLTPNACTYDECATDAECGSAVCVCRDAAKIGAPNVCFRGNCRVDADCPGTYCSPSGVDIYWNCLTGVPIGAFGYFCHGAGDECIDKEDCGGLNTSCVFDADVRHFKCITLLCTK